MTYNLEWMEYVCALTCVMPSCMQHMHTYSYILSADSSLFLLASFFLLIN